MSDVTGSDAQGGLDGLLASAQYQVSEAPIEGVEEVSEGTVDASHEGMSPESVNSAEQPPTGEPVAEQTTPRPEEPVAGTQNNEDPIVHSDPELERLRAENAELARFRQQQMQQEAFRREQEFQARLQEMTPEERTIALQQRRIQQQQQQLSEAQRHSQIQEQNTQQGAKRVMAAITLSDHGLPPFAIDSLMAANSVQEMDQIAARIKQDIESRYAPVQAQQPAQPQQQAPQQPQGQEIDPYAAGGSLGSGVRAEMPEVGSGDLDAVISSAQYEYVSNL